MVDQAEIRRRRLALKLTMQEAADRAGFSGRQQWSNIEAGQRSRISADTLQAVAIALACRMDDLMAPDPTRRVRKEKTE